MCGGIWEGSVELKKHPPGCWLGFDAGLEVVAVAYKPSVFGNAILVN
ncbi:MAG: hypothetical protein ACP5R5_12580 [Armatimonadota bacterium]